MKLNQKGLSEFIKNVQSGGEFKPEDLIEVAALYILSTAEPHVLTVRDVVADTPLDELLQEQVNNLQGYMTAKHNYQSSMTDGNKIRLCAELEKMVNLFDQMFDVMRRSTMCPEEREKLKLLFTKHAEK